METETPEKTETKSRSFLSRMRFSQIYLSALGLVGLVTDMFNYGNAQNKDMPSANYLTFVVLVCTLFGYFAWSDSKSRFRDITILVFVGAVLAKPLLIVTKHLDTVNPALVAIDAIWFLTGIAFCIGLKKPEEAPSE